METDGVSVQTPLNTLQDIKSVPKNSVEQECTQNTIIRRVINKVCTETYKMNAMYAHSKQKLIDIVNMCKPST